MQVIGLGVLALCRKAMKVAGSFEGCAFEIACLDLWDLLEQELLRKSGLPCGSS
jgi:hypothetical protein